MIKKYEGRVLKAICSVAVGAVLVGGVAMSYFRNIKPEAPSCAKTLTQIERLYNPKEGKNPESLDKKVENNQTAEIGNSELEEKVEDNQTANKGNPELYKMLRDHEGVRYERYFDSQGIATIGVGFNLEKAGAQERIEKVGGNYLAILNGKEELTDNQINILLAEDVKTAQGDARKYIGEDYDKLPKNVRLVLTDMAFNLGYTRLSEFKKLKGALKSRDYERAAKEMENSKWYKQTGKRSRALVKLVRSSERQD